MTIRLNPNIVPDLLTAIQLSVSGLVMKDSPTELLFEAITAVMSGRFWLGQSLVSDLMDLVRRLSQGPAISTPKPALSLTARERDVVQLVIAGHTNRGGFERQEGQAGGDEEHGEHEHDPDPSSRRRRHWQNYRTRRPGRRHGNLRRMAHRIDHIALRLSSAIL